jgi:hypothetical protein
VLFLIFSRLPVRGLITKTKQFESLAVMASKDGNKDSKATPSAAGNNSDKAEEKHEGAEENFMEKIAHFFADKLHLSSAEDDEDTDSNRQSHVLSHCTPQGVVDAWKKGSFTKIVTMVSTIQVP